MSEQAERFQRFITSKEVLETVIYLYTEEMMLAEEGVEVLEALIAMGSD